MANDGAFVGWENQKRVLFNVTFAKQRLACWIVSLGVATMLSNFIFVYTLVLFDQRCCQVPVTLTPLMFHGSEMCDATSGRTTVITPSVTIEFIYQPCRLPSLVDTVAISR